VENEHPLDVGLMAEATPAEAGMLPYGLQDVEQVRLLLRGDSAIDWRRLAFRDYDDVDNFLRLCGLEPDLDADALRLVYIHRVALNYLESHFEMEISPSVRNPEDVRDVLLIASRDGVDQRDACAVLKVMHVVYHVAGRELLYRMPVPVRELFHRVETKVFGAVDGMKASGVRVVEFAGSRKTPDSILTKLLSRTDSLAAEVHDRLRFRVVTESRDDLFKAVVYLLRHLLPFNYVVPGESRNDLLDLIDTLEGDPRLQPIVGLLQGARTAERRSRVNTFSHQNFRMINFVVDMPVHVDDQVAKIPNYRVKDGRVVFLLVEFQLVDRETDHANNAGDSRHALYKQRQLERVIQRLKVERDPD
jgi:uncharacterized protein (TIGR04552 family)